MGRRAKGLILLVLGLGLFVAAGIMIDQLRQDFTRYAQGTAYFGEVPAGLAGGGSEKPEADDAAPAPMPLVPTVDDRAVQVVPQSGVAFSSRLDSGPLGDWIMPQEGPLPVLYLPGRPGTVYYDTALALYPIPVGMALGGIILGLLGLVWLIFGGTRVPQRQRLRHRSAKSTHEPPDPGVGNVAWRVRLSTQNELSNARAPMWPRASGDGRAVERPTLADPGGRMLAAAVTAAVAVALALWAMGVL